MKRMIFMLSLGLFLMFGSAFADVDCEAGLTACQVLDKMFDGAPQPAINFTVAADQDVFLHADVWEGDACVGEPATMAEGTLPLIAGPVNVFIRFDPPLPPGTVISITWTVDACPVTDCLTYTIGSDPPPCGGAVAGVGYLDAPNF